MISRHTTNLEMNVLDQLHTISCTFSETVLEEASSKLSSGRASD